MFVNNINIKKLNKNKKNLSNLKLCTKFLNIPKKKLNISSKPFITLIESKTEIEEDNKTAKTAIITNSFIIKLINNSSKIKKLQLDITEKASSGVRKKTFVIKYFYSLFPQ